MPSPPHVQICLQKWTGDESNVFLCADCVSFRELQCHIDSIRRDLNIIESQAKKKFAAFKKREATWAAKSS